MLSVFKGLVMQYIFLAILLYVVVIFVKGLLSFAIENIVPVLGVVFFIVSVILINSYKENKKAERIIQEKHDFNAGIISKDIKPDGSFITISVEGNSFVPNNNTVSRTSCTNNDNEIGQNLYDQNQANEDNKSMCNASLATNDTHDRVGGGKMDDSELFHDITIEADELLPLEYGDEKSLDSFEEETGKKTYRGLTIKDVNGFPGFKLTSIGEDRYRQMKLFENKEVKDAKPVTFHSYYPCYEDLNTKQKEWYFYWRKWAREGVYFKTDLSYIYIYIYELICGIGVNDPDDGLDKLVDLLLCDENKYPYLDSYLSDWIFDYCEIHNLPHDAHEMVFNNRYETIILNYFLSKHENEHPLKLSVNTISSLSTYWFMSSTFYKYYPSLMDNLVPKIVSLIDIYFLKTYNQGLLQKFGPQQSTTVRKELFKGTMLTEQKLDVSFKQYKASKQLTDIISDSIRFSENILREQAGTRGRVRKTDFPRNYPELARLIKAFIIKSLNDSHTSKNISKQKTQALENSNVIQAEEFDLDKIRELRKQSEDVRAALEVENEEEVILLTDVAEIQTILAQISDKAKEYVIDLQLHDWTLKYDPSQQSVIDEINRISGTYIARDLVIVNGDSSVEIEYDYRDELEYIYQNNLGTGIDTDLNPSGETVPELNIANSSDTDDAGFDTELLSDELVDFISALTLTQKKVLIALLTEDSPYNIINEIANQTLSMPQQLLDEINNSASEYLGELLLEFDEDTIEVIEPYKTELKKSLGMEE